MPFFEALGGLALDSGIFDAGASITADTVLGAGVSDATLAGAGALTGTGVADAAAGLAAGATAPTAADASATLAAPAASASIPTASPSFLAPVDALGNASITAIPSVLGGGATNLGGVGLTGDLGALGASGVPAVADVSGAGGLDAFGTGATVDSTGTNLFDQFANGTTPTADVPPNPGSPDGFLQHALNSAGQYVSGHPAQAGLLGLSAVNAMRTPQLPGAAKTALGAGSQAVTQAQGILSSGGTSSPLWSQQKSSIDQQINQALQQQIAQMKQSAASNGMGGDNSGVVQQQIADLTSKAETQRQALYNQALQQIVTNAVSELTGGDNTLSSIANMQMQQTEQARNAASQTAELALLLGGG